MTVPVYDPSVGPVNSLIVTSCPLIVAEVTLMPVTLVLFKTSGVIVTVNVISWFGLTFTAFVDAVTVTSGFWPTISKLPVFVSPALAE